MIETNNVSYQVGAAKLLTDVSVEISVGEVCAILGPNGAGKSTLIRALSGEMNPSQGSVSINKQEMKYWNQKELAMHRAVVTQFNQVGFPFTVAEIVSMGLLPYKLSNTKSNSTRIIEDVMQRLDVLHLAERLYGTLSGGEQQRVAVARALVQVAGADAEKARYLLLDEPTASLDLKHQHDLLKMLKSLSKENYAIVIIVHDINLALQYADSGILLEQGCVKKSGPISEVLTCENINNVFGVNGELIELSSGGYSFHVYH
ncbi:MAG: heme ABC transporter ATP-binding protein [Pseudomonadota bacterium]